MTIVTIASSSETMTTMKTMIRNKEMTTIVTRVSSSGTMMTVKTMISDKGIITILPAVSSSKTLMTMIINREVMTIVTIASTPETTATMQRTTSYQIVDMRESRLSVLSFLEYVLSFPYISYRYAFRVRQ